MNSVSLRLLAAVAATAVAGLGACSESPAPDAAQPTDAAPAQLQSAPDGVPAQVVRVLDGDTIDVIVGGRRQRVRLLGIDAPERTTLRTGRAECGGEDARRAAQALADQTPRVTLETDPSQDEYDQYDRLLAYVTGDGADRTWQELLLTQGWVKTYVLKRRPIERLDAFTAAAAQGRADRVGVWQQCGGDFRRPE